MVADRHYEDMDEDKLLEAHNVLWRSLISCKDMNPACPINIIARDKLNLLLEYERELAFREKEK